MASVILAIHSFIGTHMALGLVNLALHFRWYPDRPLESAVGRLIVICTVMLLAWRSVVLSNSFQAIDPKALARPETSTRIWLRHVIRIVMVEDLRSTEELFALLDTACKCFAFNFF